MNEWINALPNLALIESVSGL